MDEIAEIVDWEEVHHHSQSTPFRLRSNRRNHLGTTEPLGAISRGSSIRTDTAGRAERLATLIQESCPPVAIGPVIEAPGPWIRQASVIDRSHAHDMLVQIRTGHPRYKDPAAGFRGLLKSKEAKQKASDDQTWDFNEEELSRGLHQALDSGRVGVAEILLEKGADVNFRKEVTKHKLQELRKKDVKSVPTNHIESAASTGNIDMVRLLASRGASSTNQTKALEMAVKRNLPGVVEALLPYDVDPNAIGGIIFQSAITAQNPKIVRFLRARKRVIKSLLNKCLPTAVEQG